MEINVLCEQQGKEKHDEGEEEKEEHEGFLGGWGASFHWWAETSGSLYVCLTQRVAQDQQLHHSTQFPA